MQTMNDLCVDGVDKICYALCFREAPLTECEGQILNHFPLGFKWLGGIWRLVQRLT